MERRPQRNQSPRGKRSTSSQRRAGSRNSRKPSKKAIPRVESISAKSNATNSQFEETGESTSASTRRFKNSDNDELLMAIENFLNLKDLELEASGSKKSVRAAPRRPTRARQVSPESRRRNGSRGGAEGVSDAQVSRRSTGEVKQEKAIEEVHQETEPQGGADAVPE